MIKFYKNTLIKIRSYSLEFTGDTKTDSVSNMFSVGVSKELYASTTKQDLVVFIKNALDIYELKRKKSIGAVYCWFDSMSLQIRFSIICGNCTELPFSRKILQMHSLIDVIDDAWDEYHDIYSVKENEIIIQKNKYLKVYCKELK